MQFSRIFKAVGRHHPIVDHFTGSVKVRLTLPFGTSNGGPLKEDDIEIIVGFIRFRQTAHPGGNQFNRILDYSRSR